MRGHEATAENFMMDMVSKWRDFGSKKEESNNMKRKSGKVCGDSRRYGSMTK